MRIAERRIAVVAGALAATLVVAIAVPHTPTTAIQRWWDLRQLRRSVISGGAGWIVFAPEPSRAEDGTKPILRPRPKSFRELLQLWADCSDDLVVYCGEADVLERPPDGVFVAGPPVGVDAQLMAMLFETLRFSVEKETAAGSETVWVVGGTTLETCGVR